MIGLTKYRKKKACLHFEFEILYFLNKFKSTMPRLWTKMPVAVLINKFYAKHVFYALDTVLLCQHTNVKYTICFEHNIKYIYSVHQAFIHVGNEILNHKNVPTL